MQTTPSGSSGTRALALVCVDTCVRCRFLRRLLFVHGRFNYMRIATLVQYSFYKNMVFSLPLFYFAFWTGFSGQVRERPYEALFDREQTVYDAWLMTVFNIVYTSAPILALALFDMDVPANVAAQNPFNLYERSQRNTDFTFAVRAVRVGKAGAHRCAWQTFAVWMALAAYHSLMVYGGTYVLLGETPASDGQVMGLYGIGTAMMSVCIVIVTAQVCLRHEPELLIVPSSRICPSC